jgi:hypothetical protein
MAGSVRRASAPPTIDVMVDGLEVLNESTKQQQQQQQQQRKKTNKR